MRRFISIFLLLSSVQIYSMAPKLNWDKAVENAIKRYGLPMEPQLKGWVTNAGVSYPPRNIALLAFKQERIIELWAKDENTPWRYIHTYSMTAFSGRLGPKLKENDLQIPEGVYRLTTLNPLAPCTYQ